MGKIEKKNVKDVYYIYGFVCEERITRQKSDGDVSSKT